jgi:hypothetical protein
VALLAPLDLPSETPAESLPDPERALGEPLEALAHVEAPDALHHLRFPPAHPLEIEPVLPDPHQAKLFQLTHFTSIDRAKPLPASAPALEALAMPPGPPPAPGVATPQAPPALTVAPLRDSATIATRIRPAGSAPRIFAPDAGPRMTLPGPLLPPALHSLAGAGLSKILVDRPRSSSSRSSGWLTGMFAAITVGVVLLGMVLYNTPPTAASATQVRPAPAKPAPGPNAPLPVTPTVPAASTAIPYSLAKAVEVTGFRFSGDSNAQVQYLLVNHGPAALKNVTVYVTLRASTAKPGQPALARFSFRTATLAPFESKEMTATLDKPLRAPADWQTLHADIELGQ